MNKITTFIYQKKLSFIMFIIILVLLIVLMQLPYGNVFFTYPPMFSIAYISAIFLFRISPKITTVVGLVLLCASLPWLFVGSRAYIEPLGEVSFYILSVGFIQQAWKIRQEKK